MGSFVKVLIRNWKWLQNSSGFPQREKGGGKGKEKKKEKGFDISIWNQRLTFSLEKTRGRAQFTGILSRIQGRHLTLCQQLGLYYFTCTSQLYEVVIIIISCKGPMCVFLSSAYQLNVQDSNRQDVVLASPQKTQDRKQIMPTGNAQGLVINESPYRRPPTTQQLPGTFMWQLRCKERRPQRWHLPDLETSCLR